MGGGGEASTIVQAGKLSQKEAEGGSLSRPPMHCLGHFAQVSSAGLPKTALWQPGEPWGPRPVFLCLVFSPWWVKKAKKKETSQSRDMLFI